MSFNKVILVGNLTRPIELKYTAGKGTPVGKTSIAVNRVSNVNGEKREEVCFIDLTFWGRAAEVANQYLQKGSKILVDGRLMLEQWQDQNGQNRQKHSVTVESMQMLDSKREQNYDNSYNANNGYSNSYPNSSSYNSGNSYPNGNSYGNGATFSNNYQQKNNSFAQNNFQGSSYASDGFDAEYSNSDFAQNNYQQNFGSNDFKESPKKEENLPEYDVDKDEIPF